MMKVCQYPNCHRNARFFMNWENENGKHTGLVCATHDRDLGRMNLRRAGMSMADAVVFERYLRITVNSDNCLDFPEWLEQHIREHGSPRYRGVRNG